MQFKTVHAGFLVYMNTLKTKETLIIVSDTVRTVQ
jgi:hypothetical protein